MKTVLLSLLSLLVLNYAKATDLHDQLCEFNPNWENYESYLERAPATEIYSEAHYVQVHLNQVIPILEAQTKACPIHLVMKRQELIEVLTDYKDSGRFPVNYHKDERIPVFIDDHNTHCAVGYLMRYSGHADLARSISEWNNYAWIKELDWDEISTWQQLSGFTMEELKLIQGAYDNYRFDALYLPNKHEVPQKPEVLTLYFDNDEDIWLSGHGENKVLHGAWIQNYSPGVSWIKGFYNQGKRTGRWEEYYPGTDLLQRTEHWRNDDLNGVRTRYDRNGKIIEELLFEDGEVLTKTNYDYEKDLKWIRVPLDSMHMRAKIYTIEGGLLAEGTESVYNPGNLEWFQNIELTALNMASITARDDSPQTAQSLSIPGHYGLLNRQPEASNFFNTRPLVQYHKEGEWTYYSENIYQNALEKTMWGLLEMNFKHLSSEMNLGLVEDCEITSEYDAIKAKYVKNELQEYKGYYDDQIEHVSLEYHENPRILFTSLYNSWPYEQNLSEVRQLESTYQLKSVGKLNSKGQRMGKWRHFQEDGALSRIEEFILPEEIIIPQGEGVSENHTKR